MCNIILILKTICLNYAVMQAWGITPELPIGIICHGKTNTNKFVEAISDNAIKVNRSTNTDYLRNCLIKGNSEGLFYFVPDNVHRKSEKTLSNEELIESAASLGKVDDYDVTIGLFYVFNKVLPSNYKSKVLEIHLYDEDVVYGENFQQICVPPAEKLEVVYDKIFQNCNGNFIESATYFMYPFFAKTKDLSRFENILRTATDVYETSQRYAEFGNLCESVIEEIIYFIEQNGTEVFLVEDAGTIRDLEACMLYDDSRLFVSDKLFTQMMEGLLEYIRIDDIKNKLVFEHFIDGKVGDYTQKLNYHDESGKLQRKRMILINYTRFDKLRNFIDSF